MDCKLFLRMVDAQYQIHRVPLAAKIDKVADPTTLPLQNTPSVSTTSSSSAEYMFRSSSSAPPPPSQPVSTASNDFLQAEEDDCTEIQYHYIDLRNVRASASGRFEVDATPTASPIMQELTRNMLPFIEHRLRASLPVSGHLISVPFTMLLDLVAARSCYLQQGRPFLLFEDAHEIMHARWETRVHRRISRTQQLVWCWQWFSAQSKSIMQETRSSSSCNRTGSEHIVERAIIEAKPSVSRETIKSLLDCWRAHPNLDEPPDYYVFTDSLFAGKTAIAATTETNQPGQTATPQANEQLSLAQRQLLFEDLFAKSLKLWKSVREQALSHSSVHVFASHGKRVTSTSSATPWTNALRCAEQLTGQPAPVANSLYAILERIAAPCISSLIQTAFKQRLYLSNSGRLLVFGYLHSRGIPLDTVQSFWRLMLENAGEELNAQREKELSTIYDSNNKRNAADPTTRFTWMTCDSLLKYARSQEGLLKSSNASSYVVQQPMCPFDRRASNLDIEELHTACRLSLADRLPTDKRRFINKDTNISPVVFWNTVCRVSKLNTTRRDSSAYARRK